MPIFFIIVGILFIVIAVNDRVSDLGELAKDDFSIGSKNNFIAWVVAIFIIGSLGYAKTFKPVANAFLVLVVVVMFISNKGVFDNFTKALKV